jgi:hypothetical protein
LNDLKLNVDSINTNIGTINSNLSSLQIYLNSPPATFNIYIYDSDMYGNIYLSGNDRSGSFAYWILSDISQKKRLINVNDGDTVNIILSETIIAFTNLPGMVDIAVLITFNGVTTWEAYAGDQRRSTISYTLKSTDSLQIKTGWWGPNINDPLLPGMLDPVNFSIKETINTVYYTKSQIDAKGYLTSIPLEYITETELNAKGYLTSIHAWKLKCVDTILRDSRVYVTLETISGETPVLTQQEQGKRFDLSVSRGKTFATRTLLSCACRTCARCTTYLPAVLPLLPTPLSRGRC